MPPPLAVIFHHHLLHGHLPLPSSPTFSWCCHEPLSLVLPSTNIISLLSCTTISCSFSCHHLFLPSSPVITPHAISTCYLPLPSCTVIFHTFISLCYITLLSQSLYRTLSPITNSPHHLALLSLVPPSPPIILVNIFSCHHAVPSLLLSLSTVSCTISCHNSPHHLALLLLMLLSPFTLSFCCLSVISHHKLFCSHLQ